MRSLYHNIAVFLAVATAVTSDFGEININDTVFLMVDMQEGFRSSIHFDEVAKVANVMIKAAQALQIPVFASEHVPSTYGHTDKSVYSGNVTRIFEKDTFSMLSPALEEILKNQASGMKSVVIFGVEAHICVEQSAMAFRKRDVDVHVLIDGISARSLLHRRWAIERMQQIGCFMETTESVLYKLLKTTSHPQHDYIAAMLDANPSPDVFTDICKSP